MQFVEVPDWSQPSAADAVPWPEPSRGPADGPAADTDPVPADAGPAWPRHFAVLLAEALAGARPLRQVLPLMSERGGIQLRRLQPLFGGGLRPRILRVLTAAPSPDVIEMTLIVASGGRARAVAARLERTAPAQRPLGRRRAVPPWRCTDVEAA